MGGDFLTWACGAVMKAGGYSPGGRALGGGRLRELLETGYWLRQHGLQNTPCFKTRAELYAYLASQCRLDQIPVLYLEFGVWKGDSMRQWSDLLRHPESQLHGFDSFEGLPEEWKPGYPKGHFDLGGHLPTFDDPRVTLHPGWFEDTLPGFTLPPHERLLVHLDADLYSSTRFVLDHLGPAIRPDTILLFDEFRPTGQELRAFSEFLGNTGKRVSFVAGAHYLAQAAFACMA